MTLTPVDVEAKLRGLVTEITQAQQRLRDARDVETEALIAHRRAEITATHREDCPRPSRGGVTLGERDSWLEEQTFDEWAALQRAETARETCQDALRAVLAVAETVRSLGASVRTAYSMAGSS